MSGLLHGRHQHVGPAKLLAFGVVGFAVGAMLGYIFMGTVHAMLQIKAEKHFGFDDTAGEVEKPALQPLGLSAGGGGREVQTATQDVQPSWPTTGDTIHTLVTSNGSPYLNFQNRIMYGTYKMVQKMPGGEKMVAFTRILHRTKPDILMISGEIPTFRAEPLTPACDNWCEFPVSDRPNAVAQWLRAAEKDPTLIQAPWLLMIETDYVWHKPLQAPRAEDPNANSWGFPFGYIVPTSWSLDTVIRKMYPAELGPTSNIPNSGPAPILMRVAEWVKVIPDWERLTAHIEADKESKDKLGWVREMYGFSIAVALAGIKLDLKLPPHSPLIVQPPADDGLGDAAMTHYTWGTLINDPAGKRVWEFDKRTYTAPEIQTKTPYIPLPPPFQDNWRLLDGKVVTQALYDMMVLEINQMNKAVDSLPDLTGMTE